MIAQLQQGYHCAGRLLTPLEGIPALLLRLYLVPIFWMAGTNKFNHFDDTVAWMGNSEWGLGLPLPWLMTALATATELLGAALLLLGFGTRLISVPLAITMVVAALTVHWQNGWQAIADATAPFANDAVLAAPEKLERARAILQAHGNYDWLTSSGNFVVLNNGIEFAATYCVMCLALIALGGGRYVSVDYFIAQKFSATPNR
ncbi:DoxX family protein [Simiduia aestuariiviva]|uniref:Putative membrane protein YphA (DoxX/SURF4 family) n=1 Tax=Simiduia aestuariiviva TaxID=1510459 RepID=A0A839UUF2_9GAMM|nr:DoxX family protein [Simiduia aestuariiviva]MBB3169616.1 putative membrane protein YphA (DoxX/SURF4 family) [Simiduia aestuariiviva]